MDMTEMIFEKDGSCVTVRYCPKDYEIYYQWGESMLHFGWHIMYACPKIYNEEQIKFFCNESFASFDKAISIITEKQDVINASIENFKKNNEVAELRATEIREKLRELKKQLKAGLIENKEYAKLHKDLTREKDQFFWDKHESAFSLAETLAPDECNVAQIIRNYIENQL